MSADVPKLRGQLWTLNKEAIKRLGIVAPNRPCLIVQNNVFQPYGSRTICTVTSAFAKEGKNKKVPKGLKAPRDTQVIVVPDKKNGLTQMSLISCDQLYTVQNHEFGECSGAVSEQVMAEVDVALKLALGLGI